MFFTDLHIHALYGVDDGAKTEAEMRTMVDTSYADGVRMLCMTPHFHPGYFGDNREMTQTAFSALREYVRQRYSDLQLFLGNELRYSRDCISWLRSGQCHTLNGTQYVLVDFSGTEKRSRISSGLECLLNAGYRPVLAHAERYQTLWGQMELLRSFRENGVLLQVDAQSLLGGFGFRTQMQSRRLLKAGLVELICSDSHEVRQRPPELSWCFALVRKTYGIDCARAALRDNGLRLLCGEAVKEGLD